MLPPAGILRERFYKMIEKFGPCGHIKGALLQHIQQFGPCQHIRGTLLQNIQNVRPCGHIKGTLLQNSQNSRRVDRVVSRRVASCRVVSRRVLLRRVVSTNGFTGTYFGFDICNPKLFTFKNRSSIVPSLQNIKNIQFLSILMSKNDIFEKMSKNNFDRC